MQPRGPRLLALTPAFSAEDHGVYLELLRDALTGPDAASVLNIALTGAYGTGKSSILGELAVELPRRTVNLSLSTVGAVPRPSAQDGDDASAGTVTNRIQKEIVKQLLYREQPSRVPGSRYRRIMRFGWWRMAAIAGFLGWLLFAAAYMTGITERLPTFLMPQSWRPTAPYVIAWALTSVSLLVLLRLVHHRMTVRQVSAGPATITLSDEADSFFDQYLDEIVYVFEVTKRDVVIFEDLDRFDDPHIFETLRDLNALLNSSSQLAKRRIRFVYAIKDSVFERLGESDGDDGASDDAATAELERANRTKFFDIVIPVVPFLTHRSARDVLTSVLGAAGVRVSKALTDVAARHVADMRLIKNVRNEFLVFQDRLSSDAGGLPGLTADSLLAMVLYKNVHLSDFEDIRTGRSDLDTVYSLARQLVTENIAALDAREADINHRLETSAGAEERAHLLGDRLDAYVAGVTRHFVQQPLLQVSIVLDGEAVSAAIRTAAFWRRFATSTTPLVVTCTTRYQQVVHLHMTKEDLRDPLDLPAVDEWDHLEVARAVGDLARVTEDREFLVHADMADLLGRPDLLITTEVGLRGFAEVVQTHLRSQLARDLVAGGFIDRNFTLYTSIYHGTHVGLQAMNFLIHNAQTGTMDPYFAFSSPDDVQAVLDERGPQLLDDPSVYNVEIFDHLLARGGDEAAHVMRRLPRWGEQERTILGAYLAGGRYPERLVTHLAACWSDLFVHLATQAHVDDARRVALLDAALTADSEIRFATTTAVADFLSDNVHRSAALTRDHDPHRAQRLAGRFTALGAKVPRLADVHPSVRDAIVRCWGYDLSVENLTLASGGGSDLSLDHLRSAEPAVYAYAVDALGAYLRVTATSIATPHTVRDPAAFVEILKDAAKLRASPETLEALVRRASPDCILGDLNEVPTSVWPVLARCRRLATTYANIAAYLAGHGGVDEHLASTLIGHPVITSLENVAQDDRRGLAIRLLGAGPQLLDASLRADLVKGLHLEEFLDPSDVPVEEGSLYGLMIRDDTVADGRATFDAITDLSFPTREFAMSASSALPTFFHPKDVRADELPDLFASTLVPAAVKVTVLKRLGELAADAQPPVLEAVATYAARHSCRLDTEVLDFLARGRVSESKVVELLALALDDMTTPAVEELLVLLGEPYALLTTPRRPPVKVRTSTGLLAVLARLQKDGCVSSHRPSGRPGVLAVQMRHR